MTAAPPKHRSRRITFRVVLFSILLLAVLGGAAAAIGLYARGTYYVGLDGDDVTVFKGRPGGLLWFKPTVERRTGLRSGDVPPGRIDDLKSGKQEASLTAADQYVTNLRAERAATTSTTAPPAPEPTTAPPVATPPTSQP